MRKILSLLITALVLSTSWTSPGPVAACGGFFCSSTPINQNAERIIFAVDSQQQRITTIVGINYVGEAKDFSWILPVPSRPKLDVADPISLSILDYATTVQFTNPPNYCQSLFPVMVGYGGGGGGGGGVEEGQVGPYDYAILSSDDPNQVITWLKTHSYRVTPAMEPIIMSYVKQGLFFVAMRLSQDATVGDIKPIVLTYAGIHPMIPIRLTAVAAVDDMPILTWIFGDTQYVPKNYAHPVPDFSTFRAPPTVENINGDPRAQLFFYPGSQYPGELKRIQDLYNGQAFVTEFAGSTAALRPTLYNVGPPDDLLESLFDKYPYVTRLRAQMSPDQMTVDPTFIPDPKASDVSNVVNLKDSADPILYWGCSSRDGIHSSVMKILDSLPATHTRIDELQWDVAHPAGWVLSKFQMYEHSVWAFAPRPVDASTIQAFFEGKETVPMLVAVETDNWYTDEPYVDLSLTYAFIMALSPEFRPADPASLPDFITERLSVNARYAPTASYDPVHGIMFGILAPTKNWLSNIDLYDAMLTYGGTYQYFADSSLRSSLFLSAYGMGGYKTFVVAFPYPDSWAARTNHDGDVLIAPTDVTGADASPLVRITPFIRFRKDDDQEGSPSALLDRALAWAKEYYGLSSDLKLPERDCGGKTTFFPVTFQINGLTGVVVATDAAIVAIVVPKPDDKIHIDLTAATLKALSDAYNSMVCG